MIRRLFRPGRVLSVDAYIHRATLGLPREERLDAAAELRTHLLERVAEFETQGFSREEAEYLAVKGMGDPQPVNRGLLGHAFTHRAGWGVLALLLLGGGGWWTYREWLPPREGVRYESATSEDITRLFADRDAPRGTYQAATLTYPKGTRSVVYVNVATSELKNGNDRVFINVTDVASLTAQNIRGRVPGSYRHQERWLLTTERLNCAGQARARLYVAPVTLPSPFWNSGAVLINGAAQIVGACNNPSVLLRSSGAAPSSSVPPVGEGSVRTGPDALPLGKWTVLSRLVVDPGADPNLAGPPEDGYSPSARGSFVAVLPLDHVPPQRDGGYTFGAGRIRLNGASQDLPVLPPTVPR
ncbi:permease prefix domain 1-containing protein [Deinococcus terrestris]|uniref:permease prefix domain 1-containing protein n=1 Tax=Deinococcus terrestris TaxID=2651870 RepID=UPI001883AB76|nr:permease prefix domain 1-containing protein [Deinococcus terrestris]